MLLPANPWQQVVFVFLFNLIRYLIISGAAFLLFYIIFKHRSLFAKIQHKWPSFADYRREIGYSIITFVIFAATTLSINNPAIRPYTSIYRNIHQHSMFYFWAVFPIMLIIHDAYFYWMHRLMHHPRLFKLFHVVHHKSTNPSPWASFSFQPTEAVVESGIIYLFAFAFPVHLIHLLIFLVFMTIYNVYGHLGFELFPRGFNRHRLFKWLNTSVNHNMHHQYFTKNYGLYFTWWDRMMGTLNSNYDERFDRVTTETREMRKTRNDHAGS